MSFEVGDNVIHKTKKRTGTVIRVTPKQCRIQWDNGDTGQANHTSLTVVDSTTTQNKKTKTTIRYRPAKAERTGVDRDDLDKSGTVKKLLPEFNSATSFFSTAKNTYNTLGPHYSVAILCSVVAFFSYLMSKYSFAILFLLAAVGTLYHKYKPEAENSNNSEPLPEESQTVRKKKKKDKPKPIFSSKRGSKNNDAPPRAPPTTRKEPKQRPKVRTPPIPATLAATVSGDQILMPTPLKKDKSEIAKAPKAFNYPLYGTNYNSGEPDFQDVEQGSLNNCWCCCGMMMLGHSYPAAIKKCIKQLSKTTYSITLYGVGANRGGAETVIVDNKFWVYKNSTSTPFYARCPTGKGETALWPMLLEKATAILMSRAKGKTTPSYQFLDAREEKDGGGDAPGHPSTMVRYVTNLKSNAEDFSVGHFQKKHREYAEALEQGRGCAAGTKGVIKDEMQFGDDWYLYGNHMYLVIKADEDDDGKYLTLYNPHNRGLGVKKKQSVETTLRTATVEVGKNAVKFKTYERDFNEYFSQTDIMRS